MVASTSCITIFFLKKYLFFYSVSFNFGQSVHLNLSLFNICHTYHSSYSNYYLYLFVTHNCSFISKKHMQVIMDMSSMFTLISISLIVHNKHHDRFCTFAILKLRKTREINKHKICESKQNKIKWKRNIWSEKTLLHKLPTMNLAIVLIILLKK